MLPTTIAHNHSFEVKLTSSAQNNNIDMIIYTYIVGMKSYHNLSIVIHFRHDRETETNVYDYIEDTFYGVDDPLGKEKGLKII